ncbi:MAG: TolC family protein [Pirellulales bacterium]
MKAGTFLSICALAGVSGCAFQGGQPLFSKAAEKQTPDAMHESERATRDLARELPERLPAVATPDEPPGEAVVRLASAETVGEDSRHESPARLAYDANKRLHALALDDRVVELLPPPADGENPSDNETSPLMLPEVVSAVYQSFPLLEAAYRERQIAEGWQTNAWGAFDVQADAYSIQAPLGFYKTYRSGAELTQPLWSGGYLFGGYKIGRGSYPVWYGNRETNDAGEFNGGAIVPLLRDREIDKRRAGIFKSDLARQAVEPEIRGQQIEFVREAAFAYWAWVAAGRKLQVMQRLLEFAQVRNEGIVTRVERGDLPEIDLADNERLIVSRKAKLIDAQRKFRQTAIKLSIFYRGPGGEPVIPLPERLPKEYPAHEPITDERIESDIALALQSRPELQGLALLGQQVDVDIELADNALLPGLSTGVYASQDIGEPSSSKRDKVPLVMEASVGVDVPLQRREARGKLRAAQGKRSQINAKARFYRDKIAIEVRDAGTAWMAAYRQIAQAQESVKLAAQMEEAERRKLELGDSNLLNVNLREQQSADAATVEIEAFEAYFEAEASYRAALGRAN